MSRVPAPPTTRSRRDRDRRVVYVSLTDEGRALIDRALPDHVATEHRILASLDQPGRDALAATLRDLLAALEVSRRPSDDR